MSIAGRLAHALGRRDEEPNIALAADIVKTRDETAVAELVHLVESGPKPARHDAVKVLYEAADRDPALVAPHIDATFDWLKSRDNRMLWGTLTLIDALCAEAPEQVMKHLGLVLDAADRSSVIAKDKTMSILAKLNGYPRFAPVVTPALLQRLRDAATNQFPMYAEMAAGTIGDDNRETLAGILHERRENIPHPAKKKRIEKLLRRLTRKAP